MYRYATLKPVSRNPVYTFDPTIGLVLNGTLVTSLTDAATGLTGVAPVGFEPTYVESMLNGQPGLRFSGAQYLNFGNILNMGTKARTAIVIGKTTMDGTFWAKGVSMGAPNRQVFAFLGSKPYFLYHDTANKPVTASYGRGFYRIFGQRVIRNSGGTGLARVELLGNGAILNVNTGNAPEPYNFSNNWRFLVGAQNSADDTGQNQYLTGDILYMKFWPVDLTVTEWAAEETYLKNRFGAANLGY